MTHHILYFQLFSSATGLCCCPYIHFIISNLPIGKLYYVELLCVVLRLSNVLLVAVIIGESDMHESLSLLLSLFVSCDVVM